jgi:hypothetical protein
MLEHSGDALMVFVAAWRFLLSSSYRKKKLREWRATSGSASGRAVIAGEILAATIIGMVLPLWLIAAVAGNWLD